jgi:hypothetical protein
LLACFPAAMPCRLCPRGRAPPCARCCAPVTPGSCSLVRRRLRQDGELAPAAGHFVVGVLYISAMPGVCYGLLIVLVGCCTERLWQP